MDPNDVIEGKKYIVQFKDAGRILTLHHKIQYSVKGKGGFWYFLFERNPGDRFVHVKTSRRILGPAEELP